MRRGRAASPRRHGNGPSTTPGGGARPAPEADVRQGEAVPDLRPDHASPWSVAGLAFFLQPWGLVAAAVTVVIEADLPHVGTYLFLFGFCLLASASLLAAELYMIFAPKVAEARLKRPRAWLQRHQDPAVVFGCLLLGLRLTGNSIYQLTS
ncbi:GAP family protein [Streptomyces sp. SCSIO 30461]|uniref:GAP family protein n=1 Tax=Streptomyces sp. SCSIO 30461 TaxID=3118085 RepID=UPI0030CBEC6A